MNISGQTQAVLLLTAYFSKPVKNDPRPLSPTEWGRFALWLKEKDTLPEALLTGDPASLLSRWNDKTVTLDRIRFLLGRGSALALALEKWQRAGLWVLTRSDAEYPNRLKKLLKTDSPAVLFGCGNRNLLNKGGIAVVGSRDATEADLQFASSLGSNAAAQGYSIVSGGARGIDEAAMLGSLDHEGTTIGVLADSLLRSATSAKYRKALLANNLVLISPFNPEAGFDVGNAMARNKYIYCLANAAVVVSSTKNKGGTWNGAIENLKQRWVPLWVKKHPDPSSGNAELVRQGGEWLPEGSFELVQLIKSGDQIGDNQTVHGMLKSKPCDEQMSLLEMQEQPAVVCDEALSSGKFVEKPEAAEQVTVVPPATMSFYDLFIYRLQELTAKAPITLDEMLSHLDVSKAQINEWLKRSLEEGRLKKLTKPVRYQWQTQKTLEPSIFDDQK